MYGCPLPLPSDVRSCYPMSRDPADANLGGALSPVLIPLSAGVAGPESYLFKKNKEKQKEVSLWHGPRAGIC